MSPHRQFTDDNGLRWQAWDVVPSWGERRMKQRRAKDLGPPRGTSDRRLAERRRIPGIRINLTPDLVGGWLAFECSGQRRRVVPIPQRWDELPEEALRALWREAEQLPPRRGRLIE